MTTLEPESNPELEVSEDMTPAEGLDDTESPAEQTEEAAEAAEEPTEGEIETEPEQPEEPLYTVVIDGKEKQVNLEELRAGYQTRADYTQKTQALARQREAIAQRTERLDKALETSEALIRAMHEELVGEFGNIDPSLAEDNPAEYVAKVARRDQKVQRIQAAIARHQQLHGDRAAEAQAMTENEVEEARTVLTKAVPEWRDEAKLQQGLIEVRQYLAKEGYSEERLRNMRDPLDILQARKAMLHEKLQSRLPKATKSSNAPPPAPKAPTKGVVVQKDPAKMTDREFAEWRHRQIAQRRP